jgi:hypothetical protein
MWQPYVECRLPAWLQLRALLECVLRLTGHIWGGVGELQALYSIFGSKIFIRQICRPQSGGSLKANCHVQTLIVDLAGIGGGLVL